MPRNDEKLFEYAVRLLEFHASRKAVLEVEYIDEEGTGLGPTLEFYALVCAMILCSLNVGFFFVFCIP